MVKENGVAISNFVDGKSELIISSPFSVERSKSFKMPSITASLEVGLGGSELLPCPRLEVASWRSSPTLMKFLGLVPDEFLLQLMIWVQLMFRQVRGFR